jgi:hypothetical protein
LFVASNKANPHDDIKSCAPPLGVGQDNGAADRRAFVALPSPRSRTVDLAQVAVLSPPTIASVTSPKDSPRDKDKDEPSPESPRLEEARQILEEYAADLREFIKKLRRRLN